MTAVNFTPNSASQYAPGMFITIRPESVSCMIASNYLLPQLHIVMFITRDMKSTEV